MSTPEHEPAGFQCTHCGDCCRNINDERSVYANKADITRLAGFLSLDFDEVLKQFFDTSLFCGNETAPVDVWKIRSIGGVCPFLTHDNKCFVHDAKPHQCRNGPFAFFWSENWHEIYDCMKGIKIPADWTSAKFDDMFIEDLDQLSGGDDGRGTRESDSKEN